MTYWLCSIEFVGFSVIFDRYYFFQLISFQIVRPIVNTDDKSESFLFNLKIFDFQIEHLHFQMISFELCLIWLNPHSNSTNILIGLHLNWPATYSTQIVAQSKFSWLKFPTIFEIWQNESIGIVGFNSVIFQHERCSSQRNVLFEVENWNFLLHKGAVDVVFVEKMNELIEKRSQHVVSWLLPTTTIPVQDRWIVQNILYQNLKSIFWQQFNNWIVCSVCS